MNWPSSGSKQIPVPLELVLQDQTMHRTIEGSFKNSEMKLNEIPQDLPEGKFLITFINDTGSRKNSSTMRFGQFSGPRENRAKEEDFASAEWRGDLTNDN